MRSVVLSVVVLLLVGCNGATAGQPGVAAPPPPPTSAATLTPAPPPTPVPTSAPVASQPSPTPMPVINVDDMMGMYPQQTVFVATPDKVSAITLLNHFTRYRIATNGTAQVSADRGGRWLYLLDEDTPGLRRLRVFDVPTGSERAVLSGVGDVAPDAHALSVAGVGRVLVLKSDTEHVWVDAYEALTLQPLGPVMEGSGCGDRLLTSTRRVAIVCLATGQIAVDDLRGTHAEIDGTLANLAATAMAEDGALYVASNDRRLATVAAGTTTLVSLPWPSEWSGSVVADGLTIAPGGPPQESAAIAQATDDGAWLRVFATSDVAHRKSLRLAGVPRGGVIALWPFAYYTVETSVRHVDLTSGSLETMTEVGADVVPAAVVNG